MFLVCHDHRQMRRTIVTVSSAIRGNVGPVPAKVDTKGNSVAKSAEKGLVVWEESADLSGPRRRAWRKLPQLVMTRSVAVYSSHTRLGFPGRKNVRTFWSCVLTSLAPGMTKNASSSTAKVDGFSTGQWLGCGSDWGHNLLTWEVIYHKFVRGRGSLCALPMGAYGTADWREAARSSSHFSRRVSLRSNISGERRLWNRR